MLQKMRDIGISANEISFSAVISARKKGGQWDYTLTLLHERRETSMTADGITFSAAIPTCEKGGQR